MRPCELCGKLFPPKRKDSKFCSNKCTNIRNNRLRYIRVMAKLRDKQ